MILSLEMLKRFSSSFGECKEGSPPQVWKQCSGEHQHCSSLFCFTHSYLCGQALNSQLLKHTEFKMFFQL